MTRHPRLSLRNDAHLVTVIEDSGTGRCVLGAVEAAEIDRRSKVLRQWGQGAASPRAERQAAIGMPLTQRGQTILAHEVGSVMERRLASGVGKGRAARQPAPPEVVARTPLGDDKEDE